MANLYTNDIEAGLRFYRDLLGFTETFRTPRDGTPEHVELKLDGFMIGLGTVDAARRVHGVEAAPGSPAMVLVLWTDDADAAYQELTAAGCRPSSRRTTPGTTTATPCCAIPTAISWRSSPSDPEPGRAPRAARHRPESCARLLPVSG